MSVIEMVIPANVAYRKPSSLRSSRSWTVRSWPFFS